MASLNLPHQDILNEIMFELRLVMCYFIPNGKTYVVILLNEFYVIPRPLICVGFDIKHMQNVYVPLITAFYFRK